MKPSARRESRSMVSFFRRWPASAAALVLTSSLALAEPPPDSPTSVHLTPGQPAPFSGRLLEDSEHVRSEKQCTDAVTFRKATEGNVMLSPAVVVAVVIGALATGAAVGVAVTVAAKR